VLLGKEGGVGSRRDEQRCCCCGLEGVKLRGGVVGLCGRCKKWRGVSVWGGVGKGGGCLTIVWRGREGFTDIREEVGGYGASGGRGGTLIKKRG